MIYGKRGKIGVITGGPGIATEMEFHRFVPKEVAVLTTRILLAKADPKTLIEFIDCAEEASVILAQGQPHVIVFSCTAASFVKGIGGDKEISSRIEKRTGIPTITTTTSVIEALRALKVNRLSFVTPYLDEVTEIEKVFLEDSGFKITSYKGLNHNDVIKVSNLDSDEIYRLGKATADKDAEALFISCTGLTVMHVIADMEKELKIPVVTSNQAEIWASLRKINIKDKIKGCGKLFDL